MRFVGLGPGEWFLIGLIALLLFGRKLPDVMRTIGHGVIEFENFIRRQKAENPYSNLEVLCLIILAAWTLLWLVVVGIADYFFR